MIIVQEKNLDQNTLNIINLIIYDLYEWNKTYLFSQVGKPFCNIFCLYQ